MTTNLSDRQDCFNSRKNRHCISHFSKVSGDNEIKYPCNTELQIRNRLLWVWFFSMLGVCMYLVTSMFSVALIYAGYPVFKKGWLGDKSACRILAGLRLLLDFPHLLAIKPFHRAILRQRYNGFCSAKDEKRSDASHCCISLSETW